MKKNFAIFGVGGYIAPRHLEAIKATGNNVVYAYDPNDSVGILDRYFPDAEFFTDFELLDEAIHRPGAPKLDYVSICSPNYLHRPQIGYALRAGANVICEKPLVLSTKDLIALQSLEKQTKKQVYTVLQLRVHDAIRRIREQYSPSASTARHQVNLTYVTSRGDWYHKSWKADQTHSGGIASNIGIHFFDMLVWIFGPKVSSTIETSSPRTASGRLSLERADVKWFLSIDRERLPNSASQAGKTTFRSMTVDGEEVEFSDGFTELHQSVYKDILSGGGYGIADAFAAIEIVESMRTSTNLD